MLPRVSVFTILVSHLGQSFSLDNGIAMQELVLFWLKMHNSSRSRAATTSTPQSSLKKQKQFVWIWWEARAVRIWTWPTELKDALVIMCTNILARALDNRAVTCQHGYNQQSFQHKPTMVTLDDICSCCTKSMMEDLRLDYKCLQFVNSS